MKLHVWAVTAHRWNFRLKLIAPALLSVKGSIQNMCNKLHPRVNFDSTHRGNWKRIWVIQILYVQRYLHMDLDSLEESGRWGCWRLSLWQLWIRSVIFLQIKCTLFSVAKPVQICATTYVVVQLPITFVRKLKVTFRGCLHHGPWSRPKAL